MKPFRHVAAPVGNVTLLSERGRHQQGTVCAVRGTMGYAGEESMYVSRAVLDAAYADNGLALDFYKSRLQGLRRLV